MRPQEISFSTLIQELTDLSIRQALPTAHQPIAEVADSQIGCIRMQSQMLAGIHLSSVQWRVGAHHLRFADENHSSDININLQLRGNLYSQFSCLPNTLDMQAGRHNLIQTTEPGGYHVVKAQDELEMFHLSLKPDQLRHYLDPNEALGASLLQKLDKKEAFAASPIPLSISPAILATIADLRSCPLKGRAHTLYQEAKVTELLCLLLDAYASFSLPLNVVPKRQDLEKLYALREWIQQNYLQQDLRLAGLARAFGLNEFTLKKGFKQLFNTTVFGYIQRLRMEHARLLLLEGGATVAETADALGYANPQHFSAAYKKQYGTNPGLLVNARK